MDIFERNLRMNIFQDSLCGLKPWHTPVGNDDLTRNIVSESLLGEIDGHGKRTSACAKKQDIAAIVLPVTGRYEVLESKTAGDGIFGVGA